MGDIQQVFVQTRPPKGQDPGAVEEGFFTVEAGGIVRLVTSTGKPLYSRTGKPLTRQLSNGETEREAAYRLLRDNLPARKSDFNRRLHYRNLGKI